MIDIRRAGADDAGLLSDLYTHFADRSPVYFQRCLNEGYPIFIASIDGADAGFAIVNTASRYNAFMRLNIPEIQDVNVLPDYRQRGIASALITACEDEARAMGYTDIGIAVGLNHAYGPAQRLYTKLGYLPDGAGVMYNHAAPEAQERYPLDDDLCLMLVKAF